MTGNAPNDATEVAEVTGGATTEAIDDNELRADLLSEFA